MKKQVDYIIVGKGIAGTVLALRMIEAGKSVLLIDENTKSTASKIAAGLVNPLVFKRMTKSWRMDETLPVIFNFYPKYETLFNEHFFYPKQIVKIFAEQAEVDFWNKKRVEYDFLSEPENKSSFNNIVPTPFGYGLLKNAAYLDVALFLKCADNYFSTKCEQLVEKFEYDKIMFHDNFVCYKEYQCKKIIFCEGYKAIQNPYFSYLPFKLTKGEILKISIDANFETDKVINKNMFILPIKNNEFFCGATYNWSDLTESKTENGKSELMKKLSNILSVAFVVTNQMAGIRPTVADRRPLLGTHPDKNQLAIFNGLGTKGVLYAPHLSNIMIDFLEHGKAIDAEMNIARFAK